MSIQEKIDRFQQKMKDDYKIEVLLVAEWMELVKALAEEHATTLEEVASSPLARLPECPHCIKMTTSSTVTGYKHGGPRMIPLSSVIGPWVGQGYSVVPYAKWVCVNCGHEIKA